MDQLKHLGCLLSFHLQKQSCRLRQGEVSATKEAEMKQGEQTSRFIEQLVDLTKIEDFGSSELQQKLVKMPDLALVVSKFFLNLSKYALTFYHSYQKTKKTQEKEKELGSSRAEKANKTPLKKPLTAYILYFRSKVSSFQQKHPNCTISELTRLIAREWKELDPVIKAPFIEKAANDRKRYENEKKQFRMKHMKKTESKGASEEPQSEESSQSEEKDEIEEGMLAEEELLAEEGV